MNDIYEEFSDLSLKERLLLCAINEFATHGYDGASMSNIVSKAGCSKQLVYHHFGSKEKLFISVLEYAWESIRVAEGSVVLDGLNCIDAINKLIEFTWNYYLENLWFLKLVNSENQYKASHLKKSKRFDEINKNHLNLMSSIIVKGKCEGIIKQNIDPIQLNINITALSSYYLINQHTLALVYKKDLSSMNELDERLKVIKDIIINWIKI